MADGLFQKINMGDIIQVDDRPQLLCIGKLFRRRIIRGKHDVLARHSNSL